MKNLKFLLATCSTFILLVSGCHEPSDYTACITACNTKEDVAISNYEHCLAVAAEIKSNTLIGTPETPGCFDLAGDAKANCIQMANQTYRENVKRCKETFDHDILESRSCIVQCLRTDIDERTN